MDGVNYYEGVLNRHQPDQTKNNNKKKYCSFGSELS